MSAKPGRRKRPLELYVVVLLLVAAGTIGLIDTLLAGDTGGLALTALAAAYGLHSLAAYMLFSAWKRALDYARALTAVSLAASFILYPDLDPYLFFVTAILQSYAFLALYRHEVRAVYGAD